MKHSRRAGAAVLAVAVPLAALAGLMANAESAAKIGVKFVAKPAAITKSTDAVFGLKRTVRGGVKSQACRVDTSAWRNCSTGFVVHNLAEGKHTIQVRLVMKNGRKAISTYRWVVDSVAPEAPMVYGGSAQWSTDASRMVTHFASADATPSAGLAGYERRVSNNGGGTWQAITTGDNTLISGEGDTRVQYRAIDAAGNVSDWAEAIVRLDRTNPTTPTVTGGTSVWESAASVEVVNHRDAHDDLSGIAADGYELQVRKDGDPVWVNGQIDDPSVTVKHEGATEVRFRAVDRAGNVGAWSPAEVVKLDRTAPQVPQVPNPAWSNAANVTVTATAVDTLGAITASGVDHYLVKTSRDGMTYGQADIGDGTVTTAEEGMLWISASACDEAGNCSQYSQTGPAALIDRTPPWVPYVSPTSGHSGDCLSYSTSALFNVYGGDGASGVDHFVYRATNDLGTTIEGSDPATYALYFTLTSEMISGKVNVQFATVDRAGNVSNFTNIADPYAEVCLG